ncbi:putative peptide modification system cyclase [Lysobacter sp. F60174L2]|uniref:putative peptide modification system cyclase n=1 Tax=Lysobacter sp. F60174L2 TaxID=3459295 RepID=UPI00403DA799
MPMNVQPTAVATPIVEPRDVPQLRTILLTDLVDSTALVERLGDGAAAELFRAHDRLVLQLQSEWHGRLIDRSDGLLLLFERPIDGLGFALDYFRGLQQIGAPHSVELTARAGLHVGEVLSWRNSDEAVRVGAKPVEVEGLAKPMAARLMTMARPGQLLMSAVAEPLAHRAARELGERGQHLVWKSHGRWRFKGVPQPQQIFEVGEPGITPLRAPPSGPKAWRDIPLWRRPAALAVELALVAAVGLGIWFVTRPQPAIAFNQRDWVVLADLRNLTDQPLLDDSLEQAFRISLAQSRHVNLLSDLKTRDTLARMQREPDTDLDRAIASEIAIRDGARAVILPTVAEVGGSLRVSVELIDPNSQTTVYSDYADGRGLESALASIDEVTASLRGKMGEEIEALEANSMPLPKVATENLDALRAYALGMQALDESRYSMARDQLESSTRLDPGFAMAYLGLARVFIESGNDPGAKEAAAMAMTLRARLPTHERMTVEAMAAGFGSQAEQASAKAWRALAAMYPDDFSALGYHAWMAFTMGEYDAARTAALAATSRHNPLRGYGLSMLGRVELARERYADAVRYLVEADELAGSGPSRQHLVALAAKRRFTEVDALAENLENPDIGTVGLIRRLDRTAVALDRGQWSRGLAIANGGMVAAREVNEFLAVELAFVELAARTLHAPDKVEAAEYRRMFDTAAAAADQPDHPNRAEFAYIALASLYLAQRHGDHAVVEQALPKIAPMARTVDSSRLRQLLMIVEAGQLRLQGHAGAAASKLQAMVDGGELFQVHVALRDALRADGRLDQALAEDRWIGARRGLAYVEPAGAQALQLLNVADTNLALLDAAEVHEQVGQTQQAQASLAEFQHAWPATTWPDYLRRRVEATFPASKQLSHLLNVNGDSR